MKKNQSKQTDNETIKQKNETMKTNKTTKKIDTASIVKAADARRAAVEKAKAVSSKSEAKAKSEKAKAKTDEAKAKVEEAKAMERETQAKRGELIALASAQGHELSRSYEQSTVDTLGQMLGKKWEVSLGGASLKDGAELTEVEAAKAVATLAEITERNDTVRSTTMLALGGVIISIKDQFGSEAGDRLIQQTVSVTGKSKHTVQDAERVMEWARSVFKDDHDAIAGLSYTHLQELKNGSQDRKGNLTIKPAELRKIVKKVKDGKVVAAGKKASGEPIEQRKVLSCAETRELLVEAGGGEKVDKKKSKDKGKKSEAIAPQVDPDKHLFLYIDEDLNFKHSFGLVRSMLGLDGLIVIDATDLTILNGDGAIHCASREITEADTTEDAVNVTVEETVSVSVSKASKPKAKRKTSIPE